MRTIRSVSRQRLLSIVLSLATVSPLAAQQTQNDAASNLQTTGLKAVSVILKQNVLDPAAISPKTGKPLPPTGKWQIGKERPAACPQNGPCVMILYEVPEESVSCQWVVELNGDGSDGTVVQQNQDATLYFLHKLSTSQTAGLVISKKLPQYPPIAQAAHVSGTVVIRVLVSASGTLEKVFIVSGPEMLRYSAAEAAKQWTFKPYIVGTQPVRYTADLDFDFSTSGPGIAHMTTKP